ncbi:hypothetical protein STEG23_030491 [Scotinomys teguina]
MCRLSWFLDPGGWSKTAAVGLYFIFPGICTLSLDNIQLHDAAAEILLCAVGTGWDMEGGSFPTFCFEKGVVGKISSLGSTVLT